MSGVSLKLNDFFGMHDAIVVTANPASDIGQARIRIDRSRLDVEGGLVVHPVAMNDVRDFESRNPDLTEAFDLAVEFVPFQVALGTGVRKDAVTLSLADIEGLPVSGIDEPVNVPEEQALDFDSTNSAQSK